MLQRRRAPWWLASLCGGGRGTARSGCGGSLPTSSPPQQLEGQWPAWQEWRCRATASLAARSCCDDSEHGREVVGDGGTGRVVGPLEGSRSFSIPLDLEEPGGDGIFP
jgi:hypothetical protein